MMKIVFVCIAFVLIGGVNAQPSIEWTKVSPLTTTVPPFRNQFAVVYDRIENRMIIFGGGTNQDTWAFDFDTNTWSEIVPTGTKPPGRFSMVYGYDSANNRMIIATGEGVGRAFYNDVWALSLGIGAEAWTLLCDASCANAPAARYGAAGGTWMFDSTHLIVTHGFQKSTRFKDTFSFNLATNTWTQISSDDGPHERCLHSGTVVDSNTLYIYGGCGSGGYGPCPSAEAWRLNTPPGTQSTGSWEELHKCPRPVIRSALTMAPGHATDATTASWLLLYGGSAKPYKNNAGGDVGILEISSNDWILEHGKGTEKPPNAQGIGMVYCNQDAAKVTATDFVAMWTGTTPEVWKATAEAAPATINSFGCPFIFNYRLMHGIMMFLSWGLFLPLGMMIARFGKDIGTDGLWFRIHRPMQSFGLILSIVGISMAFIMVPVGKFTAQPHATLGVIIEILGIIQPINAFFRPHTQPRTKKRIYWEYLHKNCGRLAIIGGLIQPFQGLRFILAPLWLQVLYYLYFSIFVLTFIFLEYRLYLKKKSKETESTVELKTNN